jgi:hypothetical protein
MTRIFVFLLLLSLTALAENPDLNDLSAGTALGGPDVLATIKNAETVTAQRIDSIPQEKAPRILTELGPPFTVPTAEAAALKSAFSQGATYLSPSKTCQFRANVRYGFVTAKDKISIVLCFGCGEMEVWRGDNLVSFGPFDGGYGRILEITKQLFPKDEFLAKFSEQTFKERAARMQVEKPNNPPN